MRGKQSAFGSFRDVLAEQMSSAMPELRDDVARVLEATGGNPTIATGGTAAAGQGGSTNSTNSLPARPAPAGQTGLTGSQ
jgi:mediator of RNA polymerase II transcription subunit 10